MRATPAIIQEFNHALLTLDENGEAVLALDNFKNAILNLSQQTEQDKIAIFEQIVKAEFSQNVVVIDIFARKGGNIQKAEDSYPGTHSIVLWKIGEAQFVLIDPSKQNFSSHIKEAANLFIQEQHSSVFPEGREKPSIALAKLDSEDVLYASQDRPTGYSNYDDASPLPRDCIDIAVKIAFEINEQQKLGARITNLEKTVYNNISNLNSRMQAGTGHISLALEGTPIRVLQSSQQEERRAAREFLQKHGGVIQGLIGFPKGKPNQTYKEAPKNLSTKTKNYISGIYDQEKQASDSLKIANDSKKAYCEMLEKEKK